MNPEAQKRLLITSAKQKQDITILLRPWYTFRVYFRFKTARIVKGVVHKTTHRYGYEQLASYNECFFGHKNEILLDKQEGWNNCIDMIENNPEFKGKFKYATIYSRETFPGGEFVNVHRVYAADGSYESKVEDPELTPEHNILLYPAVIGHHLYVAKQPGLTDEEILSEHLGWGPMLNNALDSPRKTGS